MQKGHVAEEAQPQVSAVGRRDCKRRAGLQTLQRKFVHYGPMEREISLGKIAPLTLVRDDDLGMADEVRR